MSGRIARCRPKDAKAGLASGAKSIGKGFLAGVVTLVAGPTAGALQEGPLGFGKGLAYGAPLPAPAACIHMQICEASIALGREHASSAESEAGDWAASSADHPQRHYLWRHHRIPSNPQIAAAPPHAVASLSSGSYIYI